MSSVVSSEEFKNLLVEKLWPIAKTVIISLLEDIHREGIIDVHGRQVHYSIWGYVHSPLKLNKIWRYRCTVVDVATQLKGSAKGKKSGTGAMKHAVEDLCQCLRANGILM